MNTPYAISGGVVVIAHTNQNDVVLVKDNERPDPRWKFPGGGIEQKDSYVTDGITGKRISVADDEKLVAMRAGLRELEEETGLRASRDKNGEVKAVWLGRQFRKEKNRYTHYILAEIDNLANLKERGNDGEETRMCSFIDIQSGDFEILKYHKDFIDMLPRQTEAVPA